MVVIGLGAGRTGSASLARLIDSQMNAVCFHELNPACVKYQGTPQPILNTVREFHRITRGGDPRLLTVDFSRARSAEKYDEFVTRTGITLMGDVAYYYLRYVETILADYPQVKFVCIRRDKEDTVSSWLRKTRFERWLSLRIADRLRSIICRMPYHQGYNYWQDHDGSVWRPDPVWDKTMPSFEAGGKREAIEKYWDYYYAEAERLAAVVGDQFRIFDIGELNNANGQKRILSFAGIDASEMVLTTVHIHASRK